MNPFMIDIHWSQSHHFSAHLQPSFRSKKWRFFPEGKAPKSALPRRLWRAPIRASGIPWVIPWQPCVVGVSIQTCRALGHVRRIRHFRLFKSGCSCLESEMFHWMLKTYKMFQGSLYKDRLYRLDCFGNLLPEWKNNWIFGTVIQTFHTHAFVWK